MKETDRGVLVPSKPGGEQRWVLVIISREGRAEFPFTDRAALSLELRILPGLLTEYIDARTSQIYFPGTPFVYMCPWKYILMTIKNS